MGPSRITTLTLTSGLGMVLTFSWCLTEWQSALRKRTRVVTSLMEHDWVGAQHTQSPFTTWTAKTYRISDDTYTETHAHMHTKSIARLTGRALHHLCPLLLTWHVSMDLTICAFWQESMDPARLKITHTADRSMKSDTWGERASSLWFAGSCCQSQPQTVTGATFVAEGGAIRSRSSNRSSWNQTWEIFLNKKRKKQQTIK